MKNKIFLFFICLILFIPNLLWISQNYITSGCLVWPLSFTCFENRENAVFEYFLINSYAKSVLEIGLPEEQIKILLNNYKWIPIWFDSHFIKIIETYLAYFLLSLSPVLFFRVRKLKAKDSNSVNESLFTFKFNNQYLIFLFISILCSLIWFFNAPGYRFGIAYNLNLILLILIPSWKVIFFQDRLFYHQSLKILMTISVIFFIYFNTAKVFQYIDRHSIEWPNIVNNIYYRE
tara:strand:- start:133 stop:831 length:699 start_codon:yes stop_codon:yes gene_type:complete